MKKINKDLILGVIILMGFILLVTTITLYFSAKTNLERQKVFENGPPSENRPNPQKYIAECDNNTDINTCNIIQTKAQIDNKFKELQKPFIIKYHLYIIPFTAFIGLLFGMIVFWAMSDKIIKTKKNLKNNTDIILKLLPNSHREIIKKLLNNNGEIRQYELNHSSDLNKIKIHRILRDLEEDEIIVKEKIGKINNIKLNKEIYSILKEEN